MARKRKAADDQTKSGTPGPPDIEPVVRAAARSIAERLDEYPSVDDLAADDEFLRTARILARPDVPVETVERLARASDAMVRAMAAAALAQRDTVSEAWVAWAFRRLNRAYAGELLYLLEAIERHAEPPLIARVLAQADDDWSWGWCLSVITGFVERRLREGEEPTATEFDNVPLVNEENVAKVIEQLEGVLPSGTIRDFDEWRRRRREIVFFRGVGRIWQPRDDESVLMSVGNRAAVAKAVEAAMREPGAESILLVGEQGVGKSSVLRDVLNRLYADGWFVFEASATELMAGQYHVGQIDTRLREIADHSGGKRVVWVMPSFAETVSAAQHSRSREGVLDRLFPYVETGSIRIVGELEPRAYERVVQQRPRVTSAFETLRLTPLSADEVALVVKHWRDHAGVDVDDVTVADALDLANHYLAAIAPPGGALRLLKASVARAATEERDVVRTPDVLATLSEASGLPLHVVDPQAPLDLDQVRAFFTERILGQEEAVECIVERITLVKAGLTDPTRPLGVFLFVGPTGTGKTELAKSLAEFLFGSPDRLVRLDMSEFQTAGSLERLLADSTWEGEAAPLISSVRAKPFSVVLLDEFEKAHRNIWNAFLQLFDDGRLTDRRGTTADFRQCVVILTSNLGAAVESGTRLGFGFESGPRFRRAGVERAVAKVFRPELLNRIDRIVVFRPFERSQMRALLERELAHVLERRGFRDRPWAVEWDEAALEFLAEKGFSAELGARPLKRAVERYLLAPLARAIVSRSFPEGEQFLFISARNERIEVTFVDPDEEAVEEKATAPADGELRLDQLVLDPTGGRREAGFLEAETARLREIIEGAEWKGRKERDLTAMQDEAFWESSDRFAVFARIEYIDRVQAAFRTAEKLLGRLLRQSQNGRALPQDLLLLLAERLYLLDRACTGTSASDPADAFVEIRASALDGADARFATQLRDMYEAWARRRGMRVRRLWSEGSHVLAVAGIGAYRILELETGLHVFEVPQDERSFDRVAVHVAVAPFNPAAPDADPSELARHALDAVAGSKTVVRRYRNEPSPLVRDSVRDWRTGRLDRVLAGEFDVMSERRA